MSVFPNDLDDDNTIIRVDDNISEVGGLAINQLRAAVFNIESEIGVGASGSKSSLTSRLNVSLNADGSLKTSALASAGLVTLPISDNQVGVTAGIKEFKLDLDFSTSDLNTLIVANKNIIDSLTLSVADLLTDFNNHLGGGPSAELRHVASHVDLNVTPTDLRDATFSWGGLINTDGYQRPASNVAEALQQINDELVTHQNIEQVNSPGAHPASAISVDASNFKEIDINIKSVQEALEELDDVEALRLGRHRSTMHAGGVPKDARSESFSNPDGYRDSVVDVTPVVAHTAHYPPGSAPVDNTNTGDNIISFNPDNTDFLFDAQFAQVKPGDVLRINYGNGLEASYLIDSLRHDPGTEWVVRINGTNLFDTDGYDAYARIDHPLFDTTTHGILALGQANQTIDANILSSLIVGDPKGAAAVGLGFDPQQLDATHYMLYLHLYPTGNPQDKIIQLPGIDITNNQGTTPGAYTLESIVSTTNKKLRSAGYNYRFIAFSTEGNFGIMLADSIDGAGFSIVSGTNSGGVLSEGSYVNNVIGDGKGSLFDALGFGRSRADVASPEYKTSYASAAEAQLPTKLILPFKHRDYTANGRRADFLAAAPQSNSDRYWSATINTRTQTASTVEVTYEVPLELKDAGLKPGKTIVVQPAIDYDDALYRDVDYGRFIIKSVFFNPCPPGGSGSTLITVLNGIHGTGIPVSSSGAVDLPVRLFFSSDSVGLNDLNVIDDTDLGTNYHRFEEVFVTDKQTTFSHTRARLPVQTGAGLLLDTDYWHISDVSLKLKGYKDTIADKRKYIRFYILTYDSTTGEYSGYIGKRSGTSISSTGPITRGRKNVPQRFYDETFVDYIELNFIDQSASSPGTAIAPVPGYVDIEIFPSLQPDDELTLLATCEVNWMPVASQNVVDRLRDRRNRGSVSEQEFTKGAKDFISAGERYLHSNGVIRGYEYTGTSGSGLGDLYFTGGMAVVNGSIVASNALTVTIPAFFDVSKGSLPQGLNWAICVNEVGNLVSILLTDSLEHTTGTEPVSGTPYHVDSATFNEIILNRKDLTIIATANVTINSITVNLVQDARRFVFNETQHIPFVWSAESSGVLSGISGSFATTESLLTWINSYGANNNTILVKGSLVVDSTIDFSSATQPFSLIGENADITITAGQGLKIKSDVKIKNITFNYDPTGLTYTAGDVVNNAYGCIFAEEASISNIEISGCTFNTDTTTQLSPYITLNLLDTGGTLDNVRILNNRFNRSSAVYQAAIAVIATSTSALSIAKNLTIDGNICSDSLGIYLTCESVGEGLLVSNCRISNNTCGSIGFLTSDGDSSDPLVKSGLTIENNNCNIIYNLGLTGATVNTFSINRGTGTISVLNNKVGYIAAGANGTSNLLEKGNLFIDSNYLTPADTTTTTNLTNNHTGFTFSTAIVVVSSFVGNHNANITNNTILSSTIAATLYQYNIGISTIAAGNVSGNVIRELSNAGYGIIGDNPANTALNITNNKIYRGITSLTAYISGPLSSTALGSVTVVENFFNSPFISGTDTNVVKNVGADWVVERNKNQTVEVVLRGPDGTWTSGAAGNQVFGLDEAKGNVYLYQFDSVLSKTFEMLYTTTGEYRFEWFVPLFGLLPTGVVVTDVSLVVFSSVVPVTLGTLDLQLSSVSGATDVTTATFTGGYSPPTEIPLSISGVNHKVSVSENCRILVYCRFDHSTSGIVTGQALKLTYRW